MRREQVPRRARSAVRRRAGPRRQELLDQLSVGPLHRPGRHGGVHPRGARGLRPRAPQRRQAATLLLLTACGGAAEVQAPPPRPLPSVEPEAAPPFPAVTHSPHASGEDACSDETLGWLAAKALADEAFDPDALVPLLRAQGEPHVRPRLVRGADRGAVLAALPAARGARHCGLAEREGGAAAVFVDALAELAPLKTQARTGEWLELTATLHVPLSAAQVVVLGPSGRPRTVPTQVHGDRVRARFALDRPGAFTVQLVGTLPAGPEPMLEAWVFADVAPSPQRDPAPGEEAGNDAEALARMVATLRREERLPPLRRKPELDALARAHAEKMRKRRGIAHDAGDGDLVLRFTEAGLTAHSIGENVARARTAALAHRILYASPSHRLNLLSTEFTELGVGTASDEAGTVYACEVFARP